MMTRSNFFVKSLFLVLLLLTVNISYSGIVVYYPGETVLNEISPPMVFYPASVQNTILGANQTSAIVNYTITTNSYNAVPYGTFDEGFDGWRYGEYDPSNVLYAYWYSGGYAGLVGYNVPGTPGFSGPNRIYGYIFILNNLTFINYNIMFLILQFDYSFIINSLLTKDNFNLSVIVYDWGTDDLYLLYTLIIDPFIDGNVSWTTVLFPVTNWTPVPGHNYALIFNLIVPYGALGTSYDFSLYLDNIELIAVTSTYSIADLEALNVTDLDGIYNVSLRAVSISGTGNVSIILSNGRYSSTPIVIQDGIVVASSTSSIPFNSSDTLDKSGYIIVAASLDAGNNIVIDCVLRYRSYGITVEYPVRIILDTP